jgi:hypothetical protein
MDFEDGFFGIGSTLIDAHTADRMVEGWLRMGGFKVVITF